MRGSAAAWWWALVSAVGAGLSAQDPSTREPPPREPAVPAKPLPEVPQAERELAEQLLRRHAERSRGVKALVADYVQRRSTELSARPLVSSGTFLFVAEPACVVFRAQRPRPSIVRLTVDCYEVYRPAQRRLERFHLGGPQLAAGLFAAVAGDAERLLRDFAIAACAPVPRGASEAGAEATTAPERVAVHLQPRTDAVGRHLRELVITLERVEARLCAVSYRDASGDLVAIELSALHGNPEPVPSAELELPDDVQVVEHAPPPEPTTPAAKPERDR